MRLSRENCELPVELCNLILARSSTFSTPYARPPPRAQQRRALHLNSVALAQPTYDPSPEKHRGPPAPPPLLPPRSSASKPSPDRTRLARREQGESRSDDTKIQERLFSLDRDDVVADEVQSSEEWAAIRESILSSLDGNVESHLKSLEPTLKEGDIPAAATPKQPEAVLSEDKPKRKRATRKKRADLLLHDPSSDAHQIPHTRPQACTLAKETLLTPYIPRPQPSPPSLLGIQKHNPHPYPQPHDLPLLSRTDWRLSAPPPPHPLASTSSAFPPILSYASKRPRSLSARQRKGRLTSSGENLVLGVGPNPQKEALRWSGTKDEAWGWKVKVPDKERADWKSADAYRIKPERLIALSKVSDEVQYKVKLSQQGTPEERERRGLTVTRTSGKWVGELANEDTLQRTIEKNRAAGVAPSAATVVTEPVALAKACVSVWSREDGLPISTAAGFVFEEGMILRFTKEKPESTSPQRPVTAKDVFAQGNLLEMTADGELVVAFQESQVFDTASSTWRIDIGLDDSSYALQQQALDNLYYDPALQRERNALHVKDVQDAFLMTGVPGQMREWTLQGTELREILVPDLDAVHRAEREGRERRLADAAFASDDSMRDVESYLSARIDGDGEATSKLIGEQLKNPSALWAENQLIHSWIQRYRRLNPIKMEGDPDLGLNESQTRAVAVSLGERLSLIQGPPGTGKSKTTIAIIKLLKKVWRVPQPILLTAPTHVSVDHLLQLLIEADINPMRAGRLSRVRPSLQDWTIEKRQESHPLWSRTEEARNESERLRKEIVHHKEQLSLRHAMAKTTLNLIDNLLIEYRAQWRKFIWLEQRLYTSLMSTADVVCATAIGCGASKVLNMVDFPIVLFDEAGMATEAVTLIPLMKGAAHATLIGDHKQLPAVITSSVAKQERLHESLFERLMSQNSVQSVLLDTQYRMRPSISAFPNQSFYRSALIDSPSVANRSTQTASSYLPKKRGASSVFISHNLPESLQWNSILNKGEADVVLAIVSDLLRRNPTLEAESIGIVTPYVAQSKWLSWLIENRSQWLLEPVLGRQRAGEVKRVEVNTVDGFQGREKDVIVLSTVRSNKGGYIGFLTDQRRLNVALTRARNALFVVGNARTLKSGGLNDLPVPVVDANPGIWRNYLTWLEEQDLVRKWKEEDFHV